MNIIYDAMFFLLQSLKQLLDAVGVGGGYALAIIALTAGLRIIMWPLNSQQTRSMKKMQELQPKLKELQERYKDQPQKLQEQMMKFYSEHKFNPLAGCLPMLVQLPIFIGLYGMLISPQFLAVAGHESFLFVDSLSRTLMSHSGQAQDQQFHVQEKDKFISGNNIEITFDSGTENTYKVRDARKVIEVSPQPLIPGDPITLSLNPAFLGDDGFPEAFLKKIKTATLTVVNENTKEVEDVTFSPSAPDETQLTAEQLANPTAMSWQLASTMPTVKADTHLNKGVLILIAIYALLTLAYQKVMSSTTPASGPQAQVMKLMPLMFIGVVAFLPIPAGVLLYLVVTMLLMFAQTLWVKIIDDKDAAKSAPPAKAQVIDINPS